VAADIVDLLGKNVAPPQTWPESTRTSMRVALHFGNGNTRVIANATSVQQYLWGAIVDWPTGWMSVGFDECRIEILGSVVAKTFGSATAIEPAWWSEASTG
jgi:uncharacterized protein YbdZ (MbtH family)